MGTNILAENFRESKERKGGPVTSGVCRELLSDTARDNAKNTIGA